MAADNLAGLMAHTARIRDRVELERAARQRQQLAAARGPSELMPLAALVAAAIPTPAPATEKPVTYAAHLEQLQRELLPLLEAHAPTTWRTIRTPLRKALRRARLEMVRRNRSTLPDSQ